MSANMNRESKTFIDRVFDALDQTLSSHHAVSLMHTLGKVCAAALVFVVLVGAVSVGWRLGVGSLSVTDNPQYQRDAEALKQLDVDLMESKQDISNRDKQIEEAQEDLDKVKQDDAKYGAFVQEVKQVQQQSRTPAITVAAIGDMTQSYGYYEIPITVHNNTSETYSFFEINYQAEDGDGNIRYAGFALAGDGTTCGPNADCAIRFFGKFNHSGLTIVPISWSVSTADNKNDYGYYGANVITKQF